MIRKTHLVIRSLGAFVIFFFTAATLPSVVLSQGTSNTYRYISEPLGLEVSLPINWQVNEYRNIGYGFSFMSPNEVFDENGELASGAYITVNDFNSTEMFYQFPSIDKSNSIPTKIGGAPASRYQPKVDNREIESVVDVFRDSVTYRFTLHYNSKDADATTYEIIFESILSSLTFRPQKGLLPEKDVDLSIVIPLIDKKASPLTNKSNGFTTNATASYQPLSFPFEKGVDWKITSGGGYRNGGMHTSNGYAEFALDFQRSDGKTGGEIGLSSTNGILSHKESTAPQCIDISIAEVSSTHDLYIQLCHVDFESYLKEGDPLVKGQVIGAVSTSGCGGYCTLPHIHIAAFTGKKVNPWLDPNTMIGIPFDSEHNLTLDGKPFPSNPTINNQYGGTGPYQSSLTSICSGTPSPTDICGKTNSTVTDIPNPDAYSCSQPGYVDFEEFTNGTDLTSGTIAGMQFITTSGYTWKVGDFSTGTYNGKYPVGEYTSHGTHWAWLGENQGSGRIDFPAGNASYISLLVSNLYPVYLDAYDAGSNLLATAGPSQANTGTGHMTELKITRATRDIAYVMVHDQGNYFAIDDVCTDAPGTPNTINRVVDQTYFMRTGQRETGNFFLDFIAGFWKYLRIYIGPFFSDVDLVLIRPDGTTVNPGDPGVIFNKTANYIEVIIKDANAGRWNYEIIANELEPGGENIRIIVDEQLIDATNGFIDRDTAGVFRPGNGLLYLKNTNTTGFADVAINYGIGGDYPVTGDWDGNGTDTIGVYRNGAFYLRNSNTVGFAELVFPFGVPGDQPVAGDWDGDGIDTIGVYRPWTGQFLLRNSNTPGPAEISFYLGNVGDVGIAGDWDGDGDDTTGVFRPINGIIFLKNTNSTGFADIALNYGIPGDKPVTGDWDADGVDTIGVYRNGMFMLRNSNTVGFADIVFGLGNPGDMPIAGDWDGMP